MFINLNFVSTTIIIPEYVINLIDDAYTLSCKRTDPIIQMSSLAILRTKFSNQSTYIFPHTFDTIIPIIHVTLSVCMSNKYNSGGHVKNCKMCC